MKQIVKFFIVSFFLSFGVQNDAQTNAKVIRVVDGDTYQLQSENKVFTVRLANVDAPESKQQFGSEATKNVSALILNQNVLVTEMGGA